MKLPPQLVDRLNANPLYKTLGLRVTSAGDGRAVSVMQPPENICWPFPGQPHGGILFTQMDSTMAWSVLSALGKGHNCSTVNFEIQYPLPAKGPEFTCEAEVRHRTGRTCFVRAESRDEKGELVAMGQATFRIIRQD